MLLFRVLCFLTLLCVASLCSSADTISSITETPAACNEGSEGAAGKCNNLSTAVSVEPQQPLRPADSESGDDPCKTVSGGPTKASCPTTPTIAGPHGVAGSGTMNTSQVSDPGDGLAGSEKQQQLEREKQQPGDAVSEPPGTLTGVNQVGSQPVLSVPGSKDGRQENEMNGDPGVSAEGSPTPGQVISGETEQNNRTQQPGGNGSQSSDSSGVSNTDTRDSQSTHSGTTEQPQSSDNNQTSQEQNGEAENANGAAKPAEDEPTKDTESTTNNEESTTTTTTTTTLPLELTNNKKKSDADSSSSISSSLWVRVPLLIVVTLACILVC
ncbi:uncharacterized protein TM35_000601170 [Trypanosoma theileri]|uniref:Mucin TcMUCII n=1 Tax=Trypanosoma theileri TaxID=67003 RepID=A0A1X0NG50_9TRYP|nr:uncharacterized protein TM35_000601170 [Trypanosoma theileri]ORC83686.1 hypothetical protein TM35_000601170 [Trypanosoma theileri]